MRATRANLSPIFSLYRRSRGGRPGRALEPATERRAVGRGDRRRRHRAPPVAGRRPGRDRTRCRTALADAELLIADGHHRYETARTYARRDRRRGRSPLRADVPGVDVGPGPDRLPDPPARSAGSRTTAARGSSEELQRDFDVDEVDADAGRARGRQRRTADVRLPRPGRALAAPAPRTRPRPSTARWRTTRRATAASTPRCWRSSCWRTRSASREDDISHQRGLAYARDLDQARELLGSGEYERRVPAAPDADRAGAGGRRRRARRCRRSRPTSTRSCSAACCSTRSRTSGSRFHAKRIRLRTSGRTSRRGDAASKSPWISRSALDHRLRRDGSPATAIRANVGTEVLKRDDRVLRPARARSRPARPSSIRTHPARGPRCGRSARTGPRRRTRSPSRARTRAPSP